MSWVFPAQVSVLSSTYQLLYLLNLYNIAISAHRQCSGRCFPKGMLPDAFLVQYLPDFFTVFIENLKLRFILCIRKRKPRIAAFKERMKSYE